MELWRNGLKSEIPDEGLKRVRFVQSTAYAEVESLRPTRCLNKKKYAEYVIPEHSQTDT